MAVYSETISDEAILSKIDKESNNILVIGCGGCMNESLAYKNSIPIYKYKDSEKCIPHATSVEVNRIYELLVNNGYNASKYVINEGIPVLCIYSEEYELNLFEGNNIPDQVLLVSCSAGLYGLSKKIGSIIKTSSITKQLGQISYSYKDQNNERVILHNESKVFLK